MADSESSRTASINIRNLLSVVSDFLAVPAAKSIDAIEEKKFLGVAKASIIDTWAKWHSARKRQDKHCRRQQRIEKQLLTLCGEYPQVELNISERVKPIIVHTDVEVDRLMPGLEMEKERESAKALLASAHARWKEADGQLGYSDAVSAENRAYQQASLLAEALWRQAARSHADVVAKLHVLIDMEDPDLVATETPWRELRGILQDLVDLAED